MHSDASTVEAYLAALPDVRRAAVQAVREVIGPYDADGFVEAHQTVRRK